MTVQRQIILEELRRFPTHPTADEVFHRVRERLPQVSLGTVYRNLDVLVRTGHAVKLGAATAQARFDGDLDQHYHIRCVHCGRLDDADFDEPAKPPSARAHAPGYEVTGYRLEFEGVCPDCQEAGAKATANA